MTPNIERKILKAIEDYMDRIQLDFLSDEAEEAVKLVIDPVEIKDEIILSLSEHLFRFDSTPYADQYCQTCQKAFGDFVSNQGARVQADDLLRPSVTIILD